MQAPLLVALVGVHGGGPGGGACKPNAEGCCDFSGEWCNHFNSDGIKYVVEQPAGTCVVSGIPHCGNGTVSGGMMSIACHAVNRTATLELTAPQDVLQWHFPGPNGHTKWFRGGNTGKLTCRGNSTPAAAPWAGLPPLSGRPLPRPLSVVFNDLFHQLTGPLPYPYNTSGFYRIPSMAVTPKGTVIALALGRFHRTDLTPNIVYVRRSTNNGESWLAPQAILADPRNRTEFSGALVVDPATDAVHFVYAASTTGCTQWITSSTDEGATWSAGVRLNATGPYPNSTYGGALAHGITLRYGPHAGRMVMALRSGCRTPKDGSFAIYSDDHGKSWAGGEMKNLLPEFGGGWTEDQVAELKNGSVLMTSRNEYGGSSGQGPRLFARSDDGGQTWAANWSLTKAGLPAAYCEGSLISDAGGAVYHGAPAGSSRANYMVHKSLDGGRTWPKATVVYPGGAAYSDMVMLKNGSLGILFEKDNYNTISFALIDP